MYSTTKERHEALRRHQLLPIIKANIVKLLKEMDGMALTYEFDKLVLLWGPDDFEAAIDELLKTGWIYIVRKRE